MSHSAVGPPPSETLCSRQLDLPIVTSLTVCEGP